MRARGSAITEALVATCAVVALGVLLGRWAGSPRPSPSPDPQLPIDEWEEIRTGGTRLGSPDARVVLATFSDFQCPYCADLALAFREAVDRDPTALALLFRHYPLPDIQPHAVAAALASECAGEQGRFEAYHDALFAAQDQIGTVAWDSIGRRAGVADEQRFRTCMAESGPAARIDADVRLANRLGVQGTPTVFADGVPVGGPWTAERLLELAAGS
ncbi:MAG TPA: thioredoxin domain-containing protein [Gemmatimonadota bacterium]|nr:thioredoxin domain-containing protein [Gemmatimonadota bacterium]